MRLLGAIVAMMLGAYTLLVVSKAAFTFLDRHASSFFDARYGWVTDSDSPSDFLAPRVMSERRKIGRGTLIIETVACGALVIGLTTGIILLFRFGGIMSTVRAFVLIIGSSVVGGVLGGAVGYLLGLIAPGYYRSVFRTGQEPWFEPTEVGIGLGVSQGLLVGLLVGGVVVLAVAWYRSRVNAPKNPAASS